VRPIVKNHYGAMIRDMSNLDTPAAVEELEGVGFGDKQAEALIDTTGRAITGAMRFQTEPHRR